MANKLIHCKTCGAEMASNAKTCPQCGAKNKKPIYKKWWFWVLIVIIIGGIVNGDNRIKKDPALTSDTPSTSTDTQEHTSSPEVSTPSSDVEKEDAPQSTPVKKTAEESYQSILDEYTSKLQNATPGLIEEYYDEAADNTDGLTGLAEISNSKIGKLAEIETDGVSEMAKVMLYQGSGNYDEYEEWAGKLYDVYEVEAGKIMDAYMDSAM